jgi:hypothetical protein
MREDGIPPCKSLTFRRRERAPLITTGYKQLPDKKNDFTRDEFSPKVNRGSPGKNPDDSY